ncbi:hypothetical protein JOB18_036224 [Solea senegalensis]|uniref:Uncharacterized protein n=1 Tax=Solea senegalensis TaxID=28829 RepID=A0AAV6PXV6_SOLSE|nr:hypothetical protein JOB18_036224 [Solea senegalensis]
MLEPDKSGFEPCLQVLQSCALRTRRAPRATLLALVKWKVSHSKHMLHTGLSLDVAALKQTTDAADLSVTTYTSAGGVWCTAESGAVADVTTRRTKAPVIEYEIAGCQADADAVMSLVTAQVISKLPTELIYSSIELVLKEEACTAISLLTIKQLSSSGYPQLRR